MYSPLEALLTKPRQEEPAPAQGEGAAHHAPQEEQRAERGQHQGEGEQLQQPQGLQQGEVELQQDQQQGQGGQLGTAASKQDPHRPGAGVGT